MSGSFFSLSVIRDNIEYPLSDGETYLLMSVDGLGMSPVRRIVEAGPQQHGETDLGFRLAPRHIALGFMVKCGESVADWFNRRNEILKIFTPGDEPLRLRIRWYEVRGDVEIEFVRQIDCFYSAELSMPPEVGLEPRWQRVALELYAPDPTWYDPNEVLVTVAGGGGQGFAVPTPIPAKVGADKFQSDVGINNPGTWEAYPVIEITGPVTGCKIERLISSLSSDALYGISGGGGGEVKVMEKLDFTGVTIPAGETYIVDCRYGQKTVTRVSDGANRIQDLTSDSNLATFHFEAGRVNLVRVSGSGINSNSSVRIHFAPRYIGV